MGSAEEMKSGSRSLYRHREPACSRPLQAGEAFDFFVGGCGNLVVNGH